MTTNAETYSTGTSEEPAALLGAAEFLLQLAEVHLDKRRSAMRAGVRHRAVAQVLDQAFQFPTGGRPWPSRTAAGHQAGMCARQTHSSQPPAVSAPAIAPAGSSHPWPTTPRSQAAAVSGSCLLYTS